MDIARSGPYTLNRFRWFLGLGRATGGQGLSPANKSFKSRRQKPLSLIPLIPKPQDSPPLNPPTPKHKTPKPQDREH